MGFNIGDLVEVTNPGHPLFQKLGRVDNINFNDEYSVEIASQYLWFKEIDLKASTKALTVNNRSVSTTGAQKELKPARHSLIPSLALNLLAEHYGKGAAKYGDTPDEPNWRKGYNWSQSYDALMRHATAFWGGEDNDPETGLPHMSAVAFHAFSLLTFMQEHPEFDDRFKQATK